MTYARPVTDSWTVRRVLDWTRSDFAAHGIDTARLDAELLVADALHVERVQLYLDLERPLTPQELGGVRDRVRRRRLREPVAYILGYREFYGLRFRVDPAVLIPRPDTETLVERALSLLSTAPTPPRVLELATGSGCIAVALASHCAALQVDATDISEAALAVARENAKAAGVADRVHFHCGDLFEAIAQAERAYGVVIANPPYLSRSELAVTAPEVHGFEPEGALVSGPTGFELHERLARGVGAHLRPGGVVLIEVGHRQAPQVVELLEEVGLEGCQTHVDYGGIERVVEARVKVEPGQSDPVEWAEPIVGAGSSESVVIG